MGASSGGFEGSPLRFLSEAERGLSVGKVEDEGSADCASRPISSLKLHGWTTLGEAWEANDTRRCLRAVALVDDVCATGKGALKEKMDAEGAVLAIGSVLFVETMAAVRITEFTDPDMKKREGEVLVPDTETDRVKPRPRCFGEAICLLLVRLAPDYRIQEKILISRAVNSCSATLWSLEKQIEGGIRNSYGKETRPTRDLPHQIDINQTEYIKLYLKHYNYTLMTSIKALPGIADRQFRSQFGKLQPSQKTVDMPDLSRRN